MSRIIRPIQRLITRVGSITTSGWNLYKRFGTGALGAWHDYSEASTLFQDSAGTIRAYEGDYIGLVLDKSGNEHHVLQETTAFKPQLLVDGAGYPYLNWDGVNDYLSCPYEQVSYPLTMAIAARVDINAAMPAMMVSAGVGQIKALGKNTVANQWFAIDINGSSVNAGQTLTNGVPHVIIGEYTVSRTRIYGDLKTVVQPLNTNAFPISQTLYLGYTAAGIQYYNGRSYGSAVLAEQLSATDRGYLQHYLASKAGITL